MSELPADEVGHLVDELDEGAPMTFTATIVVAPPEKLYEMGRQLAHLKQETPPGFRWALADLALPGRDGEVGAGWMVAPYATDPEPEELTALRRAVEKIAFTMDVACCTAVFGEHDRVLYEPLTTVRGDHPRPTVVMEWDVDGALQVATTLELRYGAGGGETALGLKVYAEVKNTPGLYVHLHQQHTMHVRPAHPRLVPRVVVEAAVRAAFVKHAKVDPRAFLVVERHKDAW